MTPEPVYNYIKGQGWVPCVYKVEVHTVGPWIVTFSNRPPEPGEHWYADAEGYPFEQSVQNVLSSVSRYPEQVSDVGAPYKKDIDLDPYYQQRSWISIKCEKP